MEVIIGAEGAHRILLKEHFPDIEFIEFPGYRISYAENIPANVKVLLQLPKMISAIHNEHELLQEIIEKRKIDAVISDNRYGLWNQHIPSVIISHQLNIQAPAGNAFLNKAIQNYIGHFNECWIPDYQGENNLSGDLSHPVPKGVNAKYMGPLSRFEQPTGLNTNKQHDLLAILSGPEPQRSILEALILKQLQNLPLVKALIIQGLPGNTHPRIPSLPSREVGKSHVEIIPHLSDNDFRDAVNNSEIIVSRAGYSTIMDLHTIGWKRSVFIPTPGQTEQEYLGELMQKKGLAISYRQKGFQLKSALEKAQNLNSVPLKSNLENCLIILDNWLEKIGGAKL